MCSKPCHTAFSTAHETHASHFNIERSTDGQKFEKIGTTKAKGKAATYEYLDRYPLSITTYYRLKMNDLNEKNDYSKVVSVSRSNVSKIKIYPNPTNNLLTIDLGNMQHATVTFLDILGRVMFNKESQTNQMTLDLSNFESGIYMLEVKSKNVSIQEKVIKQ
ncbi:MAG: T9SS type A sorting domain-containing protein [Saprospiraceae bacterium]|nr:T9SS type A sorting domain-containing protein [Saprospiraceae bacterium]